MVSIYLTQSEKRCYDKVNIITITLYQIRRVKGLKITLKNYLLTSYLYWLELSEFF